MENFKLQSKADGLELDIYLAEAEKPVALLQMCHGMVEHKERYVDFMEYMAENGISCVLHDKRGHGKSIKQPEDLGYFYAGDRFACVEDIKTINEFIHDKYPELPVFLFGHSMGSLEVRAYLKKYDNTIDGLMISGCPSPVTGMRLGAVLVELLSVIKGERHRSSIMNKLVLGAYNAPFTAEGPSQHNWISRDRDNVYSYDRDPMCGFTFTDNGFKVLMALMLENYTSRGWSCSNRELPVKFFSGEDDPCRGGDKGFAKAISFIKNAGYQNVQQRLYPGLRHEILNEKNSPYVKEELLSFIMESLNIRD